MLEMRDGASSGMELGETHDAMSGGQLTTNMKFDTVHNELMSSESLFRDEGAPTLIAMPVMKIVCLSLGLDPECFAIDAPGGPSNHR